MINDECLIGVLNTHKLLAFSLKLMKLESTAFKMMKAKILNLNSMN
jgi:hypothetical protein